MRPCSLVFLPLLSAVVVGAVGGDCGVVVAVAAAAADGGLYLQVFRFCPRRPPRSDVAVAAVDVVAPMLVQQPTGGAE